MALNGKETEILGLLRGYGLGSYEARTYFSLLVLGEAKISKITKKASVPDSKAYEVLDRLNEKGFVELTREKVPKQYRAKSLEEMTRLRIKEKKKEILELERGQTRLDKILQMVTPAHRNFYGLRLFLPSYQRRRLSI